MALQYMPKAFRLARGSHCSRHEGERTPRAAPDRGPSALERLGRRLLDQDFEAVVLVDDEEVRRHARANCVGFAKIPVHNDPHDPRLSACPVRPVNGGNSHGCVWTKGGACRPCVQPPSCRGCVRREHPRSSVHLIGSASLRRGSPSLPALAGVQSRPAWTRAAAVRAAARRDRLRVRRLMLGHRPARKQANHQALPARGGAPVPGVARVPEAKPARAVAVPAAVRQAVPAAVPAAARVPAPTRGRAARQADRASSGEAR